MVRSNPLQKCLATGDSENNNMGDKLLLNFGAKFQRLIFIISHVNLQCCHGNFSYSAKMASYERNLSPMILIANQMVYS